MKPERNPLFYAVVSMALCGASCGWWQPEAGETIRLSGNIELTQVHIAFKSSGKLIELPIDEGEPVHKGMVVARLDPVHVQRQRSRDHAALLAAQSQLAQLLTAIQQQEAAFAAEMELRRAELQQAEAHLRELESGSRKQEIEHARAAAEEARSQHIQAGRDWERAQTLFENDDISTAQYDQYRMRFDAASALLRQAEERLALVREGPREESIEAARAQTKRAAAGLKLAETTRLEIRRKEQEVEARRAEIERAHAQLSVVDAQLEDLTAISPIDGLVLVKSAEVGEVLTAGTAAATIGDLKNPWLRAYINERDLGRVKLGAKVRVTTDSYPGKAYWGRVSFIASEAEFTPKQIQTPEERVKLVYRIKIEIENPQHELKLNMPADAEIQL